MNNKSVTFLSSTAIENEKFVHFLVEVVSLRMYSPLCDNLAGNRF